MELDVYEMRIKNLGLLVQEGGGVVAFARTHEIDSTVVSNLLNRKRAFTEKGARKLERQIGLPEGYLDRDNATTGLGLDRIAAVLDQEGWIDPDTKAHVLWMLRKIRPAPDGGGNDS